MMANGSFEGVFVLLAAAAVGVACIQVALSVGERRAVRRTERIVRSVRTDTPSPGSGSAKPP